MRKLNRKRPCKHDHYLNRAKVVAERSTCLRRRVGAVIIKDDVEVSSGYVGSPREMDNCIDVGECLRRDLGIPSGQRYELCRAVHAEQNAIINAARTGVNLRGGVLYISSEKIGGAYRKTDEQTLKVYGPCMMCKKEIINVGLSRVHMREEGVAVRTYALAKIRNILHKEEQELKQEISSASRTELGK